MDHAKVAWVTICLKRAHRMQESAFSWSLTWPQKHL